MKYVLGMDLGITSIGWALLEKDDEGIRRIEDLGVRIFESLEDKSGKLENQKRREKRGARRLRRRKSYRLLRTRNLFSEYLDIQFDQLDFTKYDNPFELKIKGLNEQLSKEELAIALYHYCKYRGFKSNRKVVDKENDGKLLKKFDECESKLKKNNYTITQYLLKNRYKNDENNTDGHTLSGRIHNTGDNYIFTVTRDMYLKEIDILLNKQLEYKVINKEFCDKYKKIFTDQRSFSIGPDEHSPYGAKPGETLIEKMLGKCKFDGEIRSSKTCFSSSSFRLLSFLNNIQFKENEIGNYRSLTVEEINKIYNFAIKKNTLTYANMFKTINVSVIKVKGLDASKKKYAILINKYKKANHISNNILGEDYFEFKKYLQAELLKKEIPFFKDLHKQKKLLEQEAKNTTSLKLVEEIKKFNSDLYNYDIINEILLKNKTDEEIIKKVIEKGYSNEFANIITKMESVTETINLSTNICKKLIPLLKKGIGYDKAMKELNYDFSNLGVVVKTHKLLPPIETCINELNLTLVNPNVKHVLVEVRKLVNAIINQYGRIDEINIELPRDLAKNFKDRMNIRNEQMDRSEHNINIKAEIMKNFPNNFQELKQINYDVVLRYKLYKEQNHKCAYSNTIISKSELFDKNSCQIDHIMPYSKTFEDGYFNKVLVKTKYNQEKMDKLPYEAFKGDKWQTILNFLADKDVRISDKKKEILLSKSIDQNEWKERNLNDTKYISKLTKDIIVAYLKPNYCISVQGRMTNILKKYYGLFGLTHSYISDDYKLPRTFYAYPDTMKIDSNKKTLEIEIRRIDASIADNVVISYVKSNPNSTKELPLQVKETNIMIDYIIAHQEIVLDEFNAICSISNNSQDILSILAKKIKKENDVNQNILYEKMLMLSEKINANIKVIAEKKDRSNHLHHALDAIVIACVNPSIQQKIARIYKKDQILIDSETGEVLPRKLELPYPEFREEVKIRLYERNYNIMVKKLSHLNNYKGYNFDKGNVHVVIPVKKPKKNIKGAFTKETIFGSKEIGNKKIITTKTSVLTFNKKNMDKKIEKIVNISGGSDATILAIKKWINEGKLTTYPILPGKGNYIKKVNMIVCEDYRKKVNIKGKAYAENFDNIRVDVYKKKDGTNKLYMVPIYYFQLVKEKQSREVYYQIMWAQGDKFDYITKTKLNNEYIKVCSLPRNTLIEIEKTDNTKSICYSGGASSGMFEIYDILGDKYTLYANNFIYNVNMPRIHITISLIKSIKKINISLLGKIE